MMRSSVQIVSKENPHATKKLDLGVGINYFRDSMGLRSGDWKLTKDSFDFLNSLSCVPLSEDNYIQIFNDINLFLCKVGGFDNRKKMSFLEVLDWIGDKNGKLNDILELNNIFSEETAVYLKKNNEIVRQLFKYRGADLSSVGDALKSARQELAEAMPGDKPQIEAFVVQLEESSYQKVMTELNDGEDAFNHFKKVSPKLTKERFIEIIFNPYNFIALSTFPHTIQDSIFAFLKDNLPPKELNLKIADRLGMNETDFRFNPDKIILTLSMIVRYCPLTEILIVSQASLMDIILKDSPFKNEGLLFIDDMISHLSVQGELPTEATRCSAGEVIELYLNYLLPLSDSMKEEYRLESMVAKLDDHRRGKILEKFKDSSDLQYRYPRIYRKGLILNHRRYCDLSSQHIKKMAKNDLSFALELVQSAAEYRFVEAVNSINNPKLALYYLKRYYLSIFRVVDFQWEIDGKLNPKASHLDYHTERDFEIFSSLVKICENKGWEIGEFNEFLPKLVEFLITAVKHKLFPKNGAFFAAAKTLATLKTTNSQYVSMLADKETPKPRRKLIIEVISHSDRAIIDAVKNFPITKQERSRLVKKINKIESISRIDFKSELEIADFIRMRIKDYFSRAISSSSDLNLYLNGEALSPSQVIEMVLKVKPEYADSILNKLSPKLDKTYNRYTERYRKRPLFFGALMFQICFARKGSSLLNIPAESAQEICTKMGIEFLSDAICACITPEYFIKNFDRQSRGIERMNIDGLFDRVCEKNGFLSPNIICPETGLSLAETQACLVDYFDRSRLLATMLKINKDLTFDSIETPILKEAFGKYGVESITELDSCGYSKFWGIDRTIEFFNNKVAESKSIKSFDSGRYSASDCIVESRKWSQELIDQYKIKNLSILLDNWSSESLAFYGIDTKSNIEENIELALQQAGEGVPVIKNKGARHLNYSILLKCLATTKVREKYLGLFSFASQIKQVLGLLSLHPELWDMHSDKIKEDLLYIDIPGGLKSDLDYLRSRRGSSSLEVLYSQKENIKKWMGYATAKEIFFVAAPRSDFSLVLKDIGFIDKSDAYDFCINADYSLSQSIEILKIAFHGSIPHEIADKIFKIKLEDSISISSYQSYLSLAELIGEELIETHFTPEYWERKNVDIKRESGVLRIITSGKHRFSMSVGIFANGLVRWRKYIPESWKKAINDILQIMKINGDFDCKIIIDNGAPTIEIGHKSLEYLVKKLCLKISLSQTINDLSQIVNTKRSIPGKIRFTEGVGKCFLAQGGVYKIKDEIIKNLDLTSPTSNSEIRLENEKKIVFIAEIVKENTLAKEEYNYKRNIQRGIADAGSQSRLDRLLHSRCSLPQKKEWIEIAEDRYRSSLNQLFSPELKGEDGIKELFFVLKRLLMDFKLQPKSFKLQIKGLSAKQKDSLYSYREVLKNTFPISGSRLNISISEKSSFISCVFNKSSKIIDPKIFFVALCEIISDNKVSEDVERSSFIEQIACAKDAREVVSLAKELEVII